MSLLGGGIEFLEIDDYNDSEGGGDHRISRVGGEESSGSTMEAEKRIRREIANSNERRRMQSINAGFQSLRTLLPRHEGEKLSKAAILQQTAEYIYALEQEKTRLLSQNCQLKRLLNQHEGGDIPIKKRKTDLVDCPIVTETPDDSPDTLATVADNLARLGSEAGDLRSQLDRERRKRAQLEETVRTYETQLYPESVHSHITLQYEETADPTDELRETVAVALLPDESTEDERGDEDCHMETVPVLIPIPDEDEEPQSESEPSSRALSPVNMVIKGERSPSPLVLPSLLEAAMKAEPKVEVEVLPGPVSPDDRSRLYLAGASHSRQNLETIVEAIRHLEGDHLFEEEQQELPLALTTMKSDSCALRVEMDDLLKFHRQSRPGVIVVKHS